ncbi:MAG: hypothetical protein GY804_04015 [Alphaproteobacteria bacterium]|nr:hypothetical protein [Alphaproteobacteria bacterium]
MNGSEREIETWWVRAEKRLTMWALLGVVVFIANEFVSLRTAVEVQSAETKAIVEVIKAHIAENSDIETKQYVLISGNTKNIQGIDIRLTKVETIIDTVE